MNELALKICRQYIDGLVQAFEAGADMRAKFKSASVRGFTTDVNGTLDLPYGGRDGKRLLDMFLADFKEAGGAVWVNSGLPDQSLSGFALPQAFQKVGESFAIEPKPLQDWKQAPVIFIDDEDLVRDVTEMRGGVAIDPMDEDFEEFLENWHDLKAANDEQTWTQQRDELLAPLIANA